MTRALLADLALSRGPLGDVSWREDPDWMDRAVAVGAQAVIVAGDRLAVRGSGLDWRPLREEDVGGAMLLDCAGETRLALHRTHLPDGRSLRDVGSALSDSDAAAATTAVALSQWHLAATHCSRCGTPTVVGQAGWVRTCPNDGHVEFPRTDPAVIVLVRDPDDRALLGRRAEWPVEWFSTLAGFVEAGESAERAIAREIAEEAGVIVDPSRSEFRGSQPWPFPRSLMLGFHAFATSPAEPTPDGTEIADARWFTRDELWVAADAGAVRIPPRVSIARRLIEDWFGDELPGSWGRPVRPPGPQTSR